MALFEQVLLDLAVVGDDAVVHDEEVCNAICYRIPRNRNLDLLDPRLPYSPEVSLLLWGCELRSLGDPWVAHRVCAIPQWIAYEAVMSRCAESSEQRVIN